MRSSRIVISWVQIKAFEIASNGLSEMTKWTAARYFCFAFILHPTSCTPHITQNEMSRCRLMWASPNMIPFAALMIFVFSSKPLRSFTFRDQLHQRSTPLFRFDAYKPQPLSIGHRERRIRWKSIQLTCRALIFISNCWFCLLLSNTRIHMQCERFSFTRFFRNLAVYNAHWRTAIITNTWFASLVHSFSSCISLRIRWMANGTMFFFPFAHNCKHVYRISLS